MCLVLTKIPMDFTARLQSFVRGTFELITLSAVMVLQVNKY